MAQFWLPALVRVQVKRQKRLIWFECGPKPSLIGCCWWSQDSRRPTINDQ